MSELKLSKEMQNNLEVLIAVGMYKTRSENMKDYLRKLRAEYKDIKPIEKVRKELDYRLKERSLTEEVIKLRQEEMR